MTDTYPKPIETPCIKVCRLDSDGFCIGCGRHRNEIASWLTITAASRSIIMKALPGRLAAMDVEQKGEKTNVN
jgi:uncharacterized protein